MLCFSLRVGGGRRLFGLLLALILTAGLCTGCRTSTPAPAVSSDPSPTVSDPAPTMQPPEDPSPPLGERNPLTGEYDFSASAGTRPVAVMIGNNDTSRPQFGLDRADLLVESETEGGITRIMAVFANAARVPTQLGPVRSARSPFVQMAEALDAIYAHAGGSEAGLHTIQNSSITNINALIYDGSVFWRDAALRASKGAEYSLMTSGEKLHAHMASIKCRNTSDRAPLAFADAAVGSGAREVQISLSNLVTDSFLFNEATGVYEKNLGKLTACTPHKTVDGTTITAANVVVIYAERYNENETTINFRLTSGTGRAFIKGTAYDIQWSRSASSLSFSKADGSKLSFTPGKTYICLAATNWRSSLISR